MKGKFMDDYVIIGWPEIQYYMDEPGFAEHSALITQNDEIGIGSTTYLIATNWLDSL